MAMDLPEPYIGEWARVFHEPTRGTSLDSMRVSLEPALMKQYACGEPGGGGQEITSRV